QVRNRRFYILPLLFRLPLGPLLAVFLVPLSDQVEVARALGACDPRLVGMLWIGGLGIGGGVIRRLGRAIGIADVGEARPRIGINVPVLDLPLRVFVFLGQHLGHFF